ncbi:formimidoylglutamate deiminase [Pseudotabrizicola sp. L79]|uniref:formimidoylglutamate deiminase n=1 Tax=Pseudotabrizicola sp. L79 TaxID=3118402 RepID=UPI002F91FCBB
MTELWADWALLPTGWARDVRVTLAAGRIASVMAGSAPSGTRVGVLLPAPANAHSHAFQRAMAGLTEGRGPNPRDSFWTWRQLMFRFLDQLNPDQIQAIAAFVQMEMLEAGYACNVEFHYLHHDPGGVPYADLAETSGRIAAAASQTGIGLTLLPVLYQFGGLDQRPLAPGQIRFGNDLGRFTALHAAAKAAVSTVGPDSCTGVAPHSLRAVQPKDLLALRGMADGGPFHMHLAEQVAEVEEVQAQTGQRPVEWVLSHLAPGPDCCFIHCTQMLPTETEALARSGAVAGLCPITESSLGDGIFDGLRWFDAGGVMAIGSDSNIRIALAEELRTLDYSQRLRDHSRAALATSDLSTGRRLFQAACAGGAQAAGRHSGQIAPGLWADLMALEADHVDLAGRQGDRLLDAWIFAGDDRMVTDVWSAGRHMVQGGRHVARAQIVAAYRRAVAPLISAL